MAQQAMKNYKVFPALPGTPPKNVAAAGAGAVRTWETDQTRLNLVMIRDEIRKLFATRGGQFVYDAMDFGVAGAPGENDATIVISCTPVTAYFVSTLQRVKEVHEVRGKNTPEDEIDPPSPTI